MKTNWSVGVLECWRNSPVSQCFARATAFFLAVSASSADCLAQCCPPIINSGPNSQSVTQGMTATLSVSVSSPGLVWTNEWYFNGTNPVAGGTHSPADTNSTLQITNVQVWQQGSYSVVVGNVAGPISSTNAMLTVAALPGFVVAWGDNSSGQSTVPAWLGAAKAIAAGSFHSLALTTNGTVMGWGNNLYGQAAPPPGLSNVTALAAGNYQSLALKSDGTVAAWGENTYGQTNVPPGLSNVIAIASGKRHFLALKADGTVVGWGKSDAGQANGTVNTNYPYNASGPVVIGGIPLTNVVALAAGSDHSLALKSDGTIAGWGKNDSGQLNVPAGLTGVVALAGGQESSMALKRDGSIAYWGGDSFSQTNTPSGWSNSIAIASGDYHTLALRADGSTACWGRNNAGQASVPTGLSGLVAVSASGDHCLALEGDGSVVITAQPLNQRVKAGTNATFAVLAAGDGPLNYQWQFSGSNLPGAISATYTRTNVQASNTGPYLVVVGNAVGSVTSSVALLTILPPPVITTPPQSQTVVQGTNVTFNVVAGGDPPLSYLWTSNGFTISGATNSFYVITNVQSRMAATYRARVTNLGGTTISAAAILTVLLSPGMVAAWGDNSFGQVTVSPTLGGVKAVAAGVGHSLALINDGTVAAWGLNTSGQANVPWGLSNVVSISAHGNHSLALRGDGTVVAWGNNAYGQTNVPAGLSNVVAVAAGYNHSVALRGDGLVFAWGDNSLGQTNIPGGLSNVVAIAAGYYHTLAIKTDGSIVGWGYSFAGETVPPPGLSGVAAVAGGNLFSMALLTNRTVVVWGTGNYGITNGASSVTNVIAIAGGGYHCLALLGNGKVAAWGNNANAQTSVPGGVTNMIAIAAGDEHSLAAQGDGSPFITVQPLSRLVSPGANPSFAVMAAGYPPLSCQWLLNATNLMSQTNWNCALTKVQTCNAGAYSAVVSNGLGSTASSNAILTVTTVADPNTGTLIFSTTGNGPDTNEVVCNCGTNVVGGASEIIPFTESQPGSLFLNTDCSSFDTLLEVFRPNPTNPALMQVVACGCSDGTPGGKSLQLYVTAGQTNYILVDGVNGAYGTVYLNYSLVPPVSLQALGPNFQGQQRIQVVGRTNMNFALQASSNLMAWMSLFTTNSGVNGSTNAPFTFADPYSTGLPIRFYRALVLP